MKYKFIKYILFIAILLFSVSIYAGEDSNKQTIQKNNSSFNNDLFSGIASYNYNFSFPNGVNNITPSLGLTYNSARVDYLNQAGYGFDISNHSIFRSTKKGNNTLYTGDEYAINSDFSNNELQKVSEGNFVGILNNDINIYSLIDGSFRVKTPNGKTYYFGMNENSKQINPENNETFRWMLSKTVDQFGNEINYSYIKSDNNIYLSEIQYSIYTIKVEYYDKSFSTSSYSYGFKIENHKLIKDIIVDYGQDEIKRYSFMYSDIENIFPKLLHIKEVSGTQINDTIDFDYYSSGIGINLLKEIDNGKGLITNLEYKAASLYEHTTVPFLLKTLNKVSYHDTITGLEYSNIYDYYGGNFYFDPTNIYNRGYTGFSKVKIVDDDGSYKYVYFHQSDTDTNNSQDTLLGEFEDHISKKGRIYREEEYDAANSLYTTKLTKWVKRDKGNNIYFVMPERVINILWNKNGEHIDTAETFEYDDFGNVLKNIKYGEVSADIGTGDFEDIKNDKQVYEYSYASDANNIFLNNICETKIFDSTQNQISLQKIFYDNLGECSVSSGLVTKKSVFYSEQNKFLSQNFTYQNGLLKTESDFLGNITSYIYDSYGLLPISKTNPKGWIEKYTYNYKVQKPNQITDINGIKYKMYYDNFGNSIKKSVVNPGGSTEILLEKNIIHTEALPNYIENKKYSDENSYITSRVYVDGFGREIETKVSSKNISEFSTVKTKYDKDGNKEFVSYSIFENTLNFSSIGENEKGNKLTYDALGRMLTQTNKTGVTHFEYDILKTTQINQNGVKKDLIHDVFGNLKQVNEYNGNETYETKYQYTALNKLSKITDAKGNLRNFYYDSLGRITQQEDLHTPNSLDFGTQEFTYNDNSLLTSKKVLSGDVILYSYDVLGRLVTETLGNNVNEFIYDVGNYAKGKLTQTINDEYSEGYTYNFLGQKIEDTKVYSDTTYTLGYEYNLLGNIKKIIYPDSKETSYMYENSYVNKVNYDSTEILSNIDYEANNKPKKEVFSNGLTSEEDFDYQYGYRLVSKKSYIGENSYQDLLYTFDVVGNILNITDTSDLGIQKVSNYTYDDINRLISNQITDENNQALSLSFAYDSIGNITYNSQMGDYTYINGTNPQAVTQIGTGTTLNYDENGNVHLELVDGTEYNYDYNAKQELVQSQVNGISTNYLYDNNSSRVQKQTLNGSTTHLTRYLNNDFELQNQAYLDGSGALVSETKTKKYIFLGDTKIFTVEDVANTEAIVYNLSDHLSGAGVDISQTGAVLQRSDYHPYGGTRVLERDESYTNDYLFTGKEQDEETNLQYFEARYYSPDTGRFYSQDRVFWVFNKEFFINPQLQNGYSYVGNNPLKYVDINGEWLTSTDATSEFQKYIDKGAEFNYNFKFNAFHDTLFYKAPFTTASDTLPNYLSKTAPGKEYDIKRSTDFKVKGNKDSNQSVEVNGNIYLTSELGNFLVGLNGYRSGLNLNEINNYGLTIEAMKIEKGTTTGLGDEFQDQNYYKAGYIYGIAEKMGNFSDRQMNKIRDYLLKGAKDENKK